MCIDFVTMHIMLYFVLFIMPNVFVSNVLLYFFYTVNFT